MLEPRGYLTEAAVSGSAALEAMERDPPDLVLLDVMMPGLNGYEVVARIKGSERLKSIPVIMITALDDRDARLQALAAGAEEFLSKPVDRAELWARVRNLLRLKEYTDFLSRHNTLLNEQVEARTAALRASHRDTIATMTRAASYKDEETGAHIERISHYCVRLGETLGMPAEFLDDIAFASPMHDVGKIAIPDAILFKETPFVAQEWRVMQSHAELGARLLAGSDSPYLRMGAEIALNHHERWDGTGYPTGRAGTDIPLAARIMSILRCLRCPAQSAPVQAAFCA
jgi:putative two-component system response regulator